MTLSLERQLQYHRTLRDIGNDILIVFLIIEFILELWPEIAPNVSPWNLTPKQLLVRQGGTIWKIRRFGHVLTVLFERFGHWLANHLPSKRKLSFVAALAVAIGVGMERVQGNKVDDLNNDVRLDLIAHANKTISTRQASILSACLLSASTKGTVFTVPAMFDSGAEGYAQTMRDIFGAAGFDIRDQPPYTKSLPGVAVPGLILFVRNPASPPPQASVIQDCFDKADIALPMGKFNADLFSWLGSRDVAIAVAP